MNDIKPLTPVVPAFAVLSMMLPDDVLVPTPVATLMKPPVIVAPTPPVTVVLPPTDEVAPLAAPAVYVISPPDGPSA
jgi:hypothetical protein